METRIESTQTVWLVEENASRRLGQRKHYRFDRRERTHRRRRHGQGEAQTLEAQPKRKADAITDWNDPSHADAARPASQTNEATNITRVQEYESPRNRSL